MADIVQDFPIHVPPSIIAAGPSRTAISAARVIAGRSISEFSAATWSTGKRSRTTGDSRSDIAGMRPLANT